jgi:hypothetical protein
MSGSEEEEKKNEQFRDGLQKAQTIIRKCHYSDIQNPRRNRWLSSFLESITSPSLTVLSVVPPGLIPKNILEHEKMSDYPLSDAILTDSVVVDFNVGLFTHCPDTDFHFRKCLSYSSDKIYQLFSAVFLSGELIGVIKCTGHPVFLSFVTKRAMDGSYPLIIGGVYSVDGILAGMAGDNEDKYFSVHLQELRVNPMCLLLNTPFNVNRKRFLEFVGMFPEFKRMIIGLEDDLKWGSYTIMSIPKK